MKLLSLIAIAALTSCTVSIDPTTGKPFFTVDPAQSQALIEKGVKIINEK